MRRKSLFIYAAATALLSSLAVAVTAQAAPSSTPSVADFAQCANGAPPSASLGCPSGWTNGILQSSNSHYHEDEVVPQRAMLNVPAAGTGTSHTISFSYLTRKDSAHAHAYDSLTTWNMTQKAADRCAGLPSKVTCPTGTANTAIIPEDHTAVTPGANPDTALHERRCITDPTVCPDPGVMTMYGGTITNVSTPVHSHPLSGTGDDYATITITFTTTQSTTAQFVQLLFGGHLAPSNGPRGWGPGLGAANISGGPYHIRLDLIDGSSAGGKDNQIQAGAILPLPPDFSITKTSDAPTTGVQPGATVTYTVKVTNTGQGSGTGSFTDTYQTGVTILTLPSGCTNDAASRTITCTTGTLAPGASQTFTYTAKMPSTFPDDTYKNQLPCSNGQFRVRNTATLASGSSASADVCVNAAPHFKPVKTNNAPSSGVAPGDLVEYTVKITNDGSASGSTTYVDHYQSGVVITSVPAGCTDNGTGTLTCNTNVLAPGETQTFTYTAKMPTTFSTNDNKGLTPCSSTQQRVVNSVTVNGTTTTSNVCVNASAKFEPTKSVSPSTTIPGGTVTYRLTVTNVGTSPGVGTVTDVRQSGVTIVGALPDGCSNTNATTITCTSGVLAPGESQTWMYQATVPLVPSGNTGGGNCSNTQYRFTNTATSDGTSVTAEVCVDTARFVISKTNNSPAGGVAPGADVTYTVTVTNNGGAPGSTSFTDTYAPGVVVNDASLPAGCTDNVASRTITCTTGSIPANGGTQSFSYTAKMPTSFSDTSGLGQNPCQSDQFRVQNNAKLTGTTTGTVSNVCVNASPHFTATKSANPTSAMPGQVVQYTVVVTNNGTAPGTDSFTDTPPTGVVIQSYPNTCSLANNTLTCTTGVLAPNQSQQFVYTAKMPTSYDGTLGGSPCSNTQLKIVNHAVLSDGTTASSTVCVDEPVLVVSKSACTSNPIPANGLLSYTLSYSNTGSAPATNTVLTDTIPAGTSVADAGGGTPSTSNGRTTITWNLGTLPAGASGSKTFTVGVNPGNTSGQLVNSATITSSETSDTSNTVNNTVSNQGASASGRAYGVYANVLNVLPVGPIPDATGNQSKSLISLNTSVLSLGVLNAANSQSVTATQARDTAVASVADVGVNLGVVNVHAAAVVARSQSSASGSTATSSTNGSEVLGLTINGVNYGDISNPRVIAVVNLLGIKVAEVYVLQQIDQSGAALGGAAGAQPQNGFYNSGIGVNALRVRLLNGSADVIVSHAESRAQFPTGTPCSTSTSYVIGRAVIADELLTYPTGPTIVKVNEVVLPSTGGDVFSAINALDLLPLAGSATGLARTTGSLSPRHVDSVAEIEGASLLGGAITATTIKATASASPGSLSGSTTIVNLKIGGLAVNVLSNPPPNTVLIDVTRTLKLVVNEQIVGSGNVITVNALHLYVLGAGNPLGLPIGSDLVICGATAGTS